MVLSPVLAIYSAIIQIMKVKIRLKSKSVFSPGSLPKHRLYKSSHNAELQTNNCVSAVDIIAAIAAQIKIPANQAGK